MKEIKILWTGGWDSTFRVVELSRQSVIIQPIYVEDEDRKSKEYEYKAMENIISALNQRKETKAKINPIKIIKKSEIPLNEEITKAYKIINQETKLGSQHEWLARLSIDYPGMEMGTEAGAPETSHIIHALQEFGSLVIESGIGRLDKEISSKEGLLVLGNFRYPIIEKTEEDMLKIIKEWGYEDVMKNIWFCHTPINGRPCGMCHPCEVKMESSMEFLLPKDAVRRYRCYKLIKKVFGSRVANKVERIVISRKKGKNI